MSWLVLNSSPARLPGVTWTQRGCENCRVKAGQLILTFVAVLRGRVDRGTGVVPSHAGGHHKAAGVIWLTLITGSSPAASPSHHDSLKAVGKYFCFVFKNISAGAVEL